MIQAGMLPKTKQGVRLIFEQAGAKTWQCAATVEEAQPSGKLRLVIVGQHDFTSFPKQSITMEYFREAVVYRAKGDFHRADATSMPIALEGQITDVQKVQRRRASRLLVGLPLSYAKVNLSAEFEKDAKHRTKAQKHWSAALAQQGQTTQTEALSVTGIRFLTPTALQIGDVLYLEVNLPTGSVGCAARVVWSGQKMPAETYGKQAGAEFLHLSDDDREAIARFMAEEENRRRIR